VSLIASYSCVGCACADGAQILLPIVSESPGNVTWSDPAAICDCDGSALVIQCASNDSGGFPTGVCSFTYTSCSGFAAGSCTVLSLHPLHLRMTFVQQICNGICTVDLVESP
jgi:hypothetical protein